MKSFVIFKAGETFFSISQRIGDFEHWIINGIGSSPLPISVVDPRTCTDLPNIEEVAAAVISGSHCMVTDGDSWNDKLADWLRSAVLRDIPLLGICYGHQLLAHALGGSVGYHPGGIELGTVSVNLTRWARHDHLFSGLPDTFPVHVVHRQSVLKLPRTAVLLAGNTFEPHHAFRIGNFAWGVQFHPEFSPMAMEGYIAEITNSTPSYVQNAGTARAKSPATEAAASILPRFVRLAERRIDRQKAI